MFPINSLEELTEEGLQNLLYLVQREIAERERAELDEEENA